MTTLRDRAGTSGGLRFLLTCALLVAAVILVMMHAPWGVRLAAAAVLLLTPGCGLVTLLLGDRYDPAVRLPLTVLFGLLSWLMVALTIHLVGMRLTATTLATGVALCASVVAVASTRRTGRDVSTGSTPAPAASTTARIRGAGPVVSAVAVLVAAVLLAVWMQPRHHERYTTLSFTDAGPFTEGRYTVDRGAQVRLNWTLQGFGYQLSPSVASLRLTLDGASVEDVAVDVSPVTAADRTQAATTVAGAVTFAAPITPGNRVVRLDVVPAAVDGTSIPAPGFVSTTLEVQ